MTESGGEMPFLEHLEELRVRLVRVLLALVSGFGVGFWLVQHYQLVSLLAEPIRPWLRITGGKLTVTSPTEPVMIVLKLALIVGLILASPVIIYQVWGFLSPALYQREKRMLIPSLLVGTALFGVGAAFGFGYLVPQSLPILFSFQSEGLAVLITYSEYFSFVLQIVLAMGLAFEIPLVIMLLTGLGLITPAGLGRFRRYAIILAAIAGAVLSPGTDILSMILMTVPILLLYEIGYLGSWVIHRRQVRKAALASAVLLLILVSTTGRLAAQQDTVPTKVPAKFQKPFPPVTQAADTTDTLPRARPGQAVDTATARRLGLPTAPRRTFAPDDSIVSALLKLPGYQATRFRSDTALVLADERRLYLRGEASTRRGETTLEADSIAYQETDCLMRATGDPALFDKETVLSGFGGIRYNTCIRRGVVSDALTTFKQDGKDWFLRGNLAQDSSASRLYASEGEITSCDLPEPHYHFSAREVKWISKTVMVARPAVLYIRDVPVLWLPFVFQDARPGRRSGILVPRFGLNDIVRQNPGYNRQVTNIGYYWAPNDYFDVTAKLDWYSNRYTEYGGAASYRVLNRFLSGGLAYSRLSENTGRRTTNIRWDHRQSFDLSTSLNLSLNYSSSGFVRQRNALDPLQQTQQIVSSANFSKRYPWGTIALGGNRRQNLSDKSVTMQLPSLGISPKPIDLSSNVTWSPSFTLSNSYENNFPVSPTAFAVLPGGGLDTLGLTRDKRTTTMNLDTPLRFGSFSWRNTVGYSDVKQTGRASSSVKVPDPTTPDPTDSITVFRATTSDFAGQLDWQTGINLPLLFHNSWKVQPSVNVTNSVSGQPFLVRNPNTNGAWVSQGKRFNMTFAASPAFFGFFPGFGPIERIRHSFSPSISYSYSPSASVPQDFAAAITQPGQTPRLRSDPTQLLTFGLDQNFEGKARRADGDTSSIDNSRKFRLLGIQTTSMQYDFEQAKLPGRNGWKSQTLGNTFQSDLVPGFSFATEHDLWRGPVGNDSSKFSPFLTRVTAGFSISSNTVRTLLGLVGLSKAGVDSLNKGPTQPTSRTGSDSRFGGAPSFGGYGADQTIGLGTNRAFSARVDYNLSRSRGGSSPAAQSVGLNTNFAPTPFWSVTWSTQYNITDRKFEAQTVDLTRVLHEWRASFRLLKGPNGNFAFYFSVFLSDLPDIKFDYNQSSFDK